MGDISKKERDYGLMHTKYVKPWLPECEKCKYDKWPSMYYPCRCCKHNYKSMFERSEKE